MVGARVIRIVEVQRQNVVHLNRGEMSPSLVVFRPEDAGDQHRLPRRHRHITQGQQTRQHPVGREDWERLKTNIPMGRPGTGTDVASTIVFLCSDQGHWISGQSINIDGGQVSSH